MARRYQTQFEGTVNEYVGFDRNLTDAPYVAIVGIGGTIEVFALDDYTPIIRSQLVRYLLSVGMPFSILDYYKKV